MASKLNGIKMIVLALVLLLIILILPSNLVESAALPIVNVTVSPSVEITKNTMSLGFQLDGQEISLWQQSQTLRNLATASNFKLVRVFTYLIEPCSKWSESTKTGTWSWTKVDNLVKSMNAAGCEPLLVLGFFSWASGGIVAPSGMTKSSTTGLPNPDQWAAYCKEWVRHFKTVGLKVKYYEIGNEIYHYWEKNGWPIAQPKLSYFMNLFNAAAKSMRSVDSTIKIGNDASTMKGVLDYFISNGEKLDFLSFHAYATGSLSATDASILSAAETYGINENRLTFYGVQKARELYKAAKGVTLPVIESENNANYAYSTGTDPRIQQMLGAVYAALRIRTMILNNCDYHVYFHLSSSASKEKLKATGGYGFGMINSDNLQPWYPYFSQKIISANLAVGDSILQTTSTSGNIRTLAWIHGSTLNLLIISKTSQTQNVNVQGFSSQINYVKIDNSISWKTPQIQNGTFALQNSLTLNGYTVMILQCNR